MIDFISGGDARCSCRNNYGRSCCKSSQSYFLYIFFGAVHGTLHICVQYNLSYVVSHTMRKLSERQGGLAKHPSRISNRLPVSRKGDSGTGVEILPGRRSNSLAKFINAVMVAAATIVWAPHTDPYQAGPPACQYHRPLQEADAASVQLLTCFIVELHSPTLPPAMDTTRRPAPRRFTQADTPARVCAFSSNGAQPSVRCGVRPESRGRTPLR